MGSSWRLSTPEDLGEATGGSRAQGWGHTAVHAGGRLSGSAGCLCGSSHLQPCGAVVKSKSLGRAPASNKPAGWGDEK